MDNARRMGYDRGMVEDVSQAGRADRRRLGGARMSAETGSVGWDGDGAWDGRAVRMPLGTGHPPVGPQRVGRPF